MIFAIRFFTVCILLLAFCVLGFMFAISPLGIDELLIHAAFIWLCVSVVYGVIDFLFSRRVAG